MSTAYGRKTYGPAPADDPSLYCLRLYVQYLQGLFNQMPTDSFHWEPDDEVSEIVIRAQAPLDLKTVGKRPALTVVQGPYNFMNLGIDNMVSYNMSTEEKTRTDLISGHLVVYCLGDGDIIPMKLAHLVSHHTRCDSRLLEGPGGFYTIARPAPSINSPSAPGQLIMGDPEGLVMVQVNIPYAFQWTWKVTPLSSPILRNLQQITKHRRASEYEYEEMDTVEHIQLAMSTSPVKVKRFDGSVAIAQPGTDDFQISGLEPFQTEE